MRNLINKFNTAAGSKEVIFYSFVLLLVRGSGGALGVVSAWLITRLLGAEDSGLYFFSFALLTILSVVSRFGFDKTVFRFVSQNSARNLWQYVYGFIFQAFTAVITFSILSACALYYASGAISELAFGDLRALTLLHIVACSLPLVSLSSIAGEALQALNCRIASAFIIFTAPFFFMTVALLFIFLFKIHCSILIVSYLIFLSYALTFLIGVSLLFLFLPKFTSGSSLPIPEILSSCFPLFFVDIMATLTCWISQVYLGFYMTSTDVALLASAQRIGAMVSLLVSALIMVTAPKLAKLYATGKHHELEIFVKQSVAVTVFTAIPFLIGICYFSGALISYFIEGVSDGGAVLSMLAIGLFFNAFNGFCSYLLLVSGNEKMLRAAMLLGCLIAVALPLVLIPLYGVLGAVFSVTIGWVLQCVFSIFFVKKVMGFNIFDGVLFRNNY